MARISGPLGVETMLALCLPLVLIVCFPLQLLAYAMPASPTLLQILVSEGLRNLLNSRVLRPSPRLAYGLHLVRNDSSSEGS